jgi:hypothetical protein
MMVLLEGLENILRRSKHQRQLVRDGVPLTVLFDEAGGVTVVRAIVAGNNQHGEWEEASARAKAIIRQFIDC